MDVCDAPPVEEEEEEVDPFSEDFCVGEAMTRDDALAYIAPGEQFGKRLPLLESGAQTWMRSCGPTGCADWEPSSTRVENSFEIMTVVYGKIAPAE